MQQQSKCYLPLRRMITDIRQDCMLKQKRIMPLEISTPIPPNGTKWKGKAMFFELDNFRDRGFPKFIEGEVFMNNELIKYLKNEFHGISAHSHFIAIESW